MSPILLYIISQHEVSIMEESVRAELQELAKLSYPDLKDRCRQKGLGIGGSRISC